MAAKQHVYHVHNESDVLHMNLNIKANFTKRDDKIKMIDIYHVKCYPYLGLEKCAMRKIPCVCLPLRHSLKQQWQENVDAEKQP